MNEKSFTESLSKLQNAAVDISKQATSLEDSLKLFDEGLQEAEYCKDILDKASQKIEIYENGEIQDADL